MYHSTVVDVAQAWERMTRVQSLATTACMLKQPCTRQRTPASVTSLLSTNHHLRSETLACRQSSCAFPATLSLWLSNVSSQTGCEAMHKEVEKVEGQIRLTVKMKQRTGTQPPGHKVTNAQHTRKNTDNDVTNLHTKIHSRSLKQAWDELRVYVLVWLGEWGL